MTKPKSPLVSGIVAGEPDIMGGPSGLPQSNSDTTPGGAADGAGADIGGLAGSMIGGKVGGATGEAIGSTVGKVVGSAITGGLGSAMGGNNSGGFDPTSGGFAGPLGDMTSGGATGPLGGGGSLDAISSGGFAGPLGDGPQEYYPISPANPNSPLGGPGGGMGGGGGGQRPPNANSVWFTITMQGGQFGVYSFTGREEAHKPYEFIVELVNKSASVDIGSIPGTPACLTITDRSNEKRLVHGIVREMKQLHTANAFTHYRAIIVPRLYFLGQITDCRIFQNMTTVDIIQKILKEQGFTGDQSSFKVGQTLEPREYCVQYNESYLHFITRLCEEDGIFFYFTHKEDSHCVCFYDYAGGDPIPGTPSLRYFQGSGQPADYAVISRLELSHRVNSNAAMYKEWNFTKPKLDLTVKEQEGDTKKAPVPSGMTLEQYQYPHIYDLKGPGTRYVKLEVERNLAFAKWIDCQADVCRFLPGHTFSVMQHPRQDINASWWVFTVEHEGEQPGVLQHEAPSDRGLYYRSLVRAIPQETRFVPQWEHPKHRVIGTQTAIVTGPKGEEIYPDKYGRVKVQFFWDREGKWDDKTTCWIRASQGWAGPNFGTMAIPRIGHEVIVSFLEGDPDRPLITGRVYHDINMPPYPLPDNKTRTVFKSMSTPGEEGEKRGFNELRIEDKKSEEEIYVHAEKDVNVYVKNDWKEHILHDKHETVDHFRYTHIKEEEHVLIEKDRRQELKEKDYLTVHNDSHTEYKTKWLAKAGEEIHLKAGTKVVMEAGADLTIKAGGAFVRLNDAGVTIVGKEINLNSGGSPGNGTGVSMEEPEEALRPGESPKPKKDTLKLKDGEEKQAASGGGGGGAAAASNSAPEMASAHTPFNERHLCRQELADMAKASDDPEIRALGEEFQQDLIAEQHAELANHVYDPTSPPPEGWEILNDNPEELQKFNLKPEQLKIENSNFGAALYRPKPGYFGDAMKPTVAFKGTQQVFGEDTTQNNIPQAFGATAPYYEKASDIGRRLKKEDIHFTGHSLGGGLASTAGVFSGKPANTYNAAGVHQTTVQKAPDVFKQSATTYITSYRVPGDPLTGAQEAKGYTLWDPSFGSIDMINMAGDNLPDALGKPVSIPSSYASLEENIYLSDPSFGTLHHARKNPHSMIVAQKGIQEKRQATQQQLEEKLGKKC